MSNCKPRYVCTGLILMALSWTLGRINASITYAPLLRYVCLIMLIPAIFVFINSKTTLGKCIIYITNTAICCGGFFYAIYFRQPLGFIVIFCSWVSSIYYFLYSEEKKKDKLPIMLTNIVLCFVTIALFLHSANRMFNPIHSGLLNGGSVIW